MIVEQNQTDDIRQQPGAAHNAHELRTLHLLRLD